MHKQQSKIRRLRAHQRWKQAVASDRADASNHPQWIKAERASDKKRSSALIWGRWSTTSGESWKSAAPQKLEEEGDNEEVVAEPRKCSHCGAVTADGCFKFCPKCGAVLPSSVYMIARQHADHAVVGARV